MMYRRFNLGMLAALALGCAPMAGLHDSAGREPEPEPEPEQGGRRLAAAERDADERIITLPPGQLPGRDEHRRRARGKRKARKAAARRRKKRRGW